ncbi:crossover junction endonuclease EME1 isoform X2 [Geospiza fortis]|uniref:Crossover junction endonuclease EME1 isoform X2 n=2 Tax=Thraupidae TaxID=400783 RepID=A0A8N5ERT2_GEOFO|nr:crossover junction endonuclease EME1 isoform X2 [Camarhynchus parvulus]XP_030915797.1 crossover junction endonuclease EME1 isoform X2 [Geospiza fortis]
MAERESGSESSEEETLPSFAYLLQPPPCLGEPSRPRSPSPEPEVAEVVEMVSSGSEEGVDVVPSHEIVKMRVGAEPEPFNLGADDEGEASGLCATGDLMASGSEGLRQDLTPSGEVACNSETGTRSVGTSSLCSLPVDSDRPSSPPVSRERPETSLPLKKRQYSQKEREAICQNAWQRRKEQEAKTRKQEEEKERKRAVAKMLKAQRPGECQKYITVVLDPVILQVEGGKQILSALQAANYSCVFENHAVPCSITWRRKTVTSQNADGCAERQKETLQSYVARTMEKMPGRILALAVVGVENYFRSLQVQPKQRLRQTASGNQEKRGGRRKKESKDSNLDLSRMDVKEALVDLQLSTQVQISIFESNEELGEYATMFTKAVAEAPYKRERENTGFSFYLEKDCCRGVKVDPSGKGLLKVWKRQIQQFNRVSSEMAEAIVSAYPSPQLLIQAYEKCSSDQERENMLANIPVHRGEGVTATSRRIGPELSRRIYLQMTSHDPDLCLDFTG